LKGVRQASTAATLKGERDREMTQAMQEYKDEQRARQANMARLRALRLAREYTESKATAAPQSAKKKAATQTGSAPRASS
jgi:hypothetical protein